MAATNKNSWVASALRRWYAALAVALALIVWGGLALGLRPTKDESGSYAARPYGLMAGVENYALDQLFQARDALHPNLRTRGYSEPITIIYIDEASIKASGVRLQKWPRNWYARLIDRASEGGASVIGLDIFLSEMGGTSVADQAYDQQLVEAMTRAGNVVIAKK